MKEIPWTTPASLLVEIREGEPMPPTPTLGIAVRRYAELDSERQSTALITIEADIAFGEALPKRMFHGAEIDALVALLP